MSDRSALVASDGTRGFARVEVFTGQWCTIIIMDDSYAMTVHVTC
jgi:hypothetical protein